MYPSLSDCPAAPGDDMSTSRYSELSDSSDINSLGPGVDGEEGLEAPRDEEQEISQSMSVAGLYRPWIHTHTELNDLSRTEEN